MSHPRNVSILYRRILELHRHLPAKAREVGNAYAREEFKLHKDVDIVMRNRFLLEWEKYVMMMREQLGSGSSFGADVDESKLSAEQRKQLQSLEKEITGQPPTG
eukprot:scpid84177/ scgid14400/ Protein ACN9 homolog, mitochondrial; Liver regeneration-related protein LRRGT00092